MKVKQGDNVLVTAGKNKGAKGKVMRVMKKNEKIVVEKVNMRKKHVKKTQSRPGEIITYEAPIHVSNVKVVCPGCNKGVRVGYTILESGKKQRVCKKCQQSLDKAVESKK
jgi:large subunit ribosomal protein L24